MIEGVWYTLICWMCYVRCQHLYSQASCNPKCEFLYLCFFWWILQIWQSAILKIGPCLPIWQYLIGFDKSCDNPIIALLNRRKLAHIIFDLNPFHTNWLIVSWSVISCSRTRSCVGIWNKLNWSWSSLYLEWSENMRCAVVSWELNRIRPWLMAQLWSGIP